MDLRIPDAGDAVTEVEMIEWLVENGQTVAVGDTLYSIESGKATVEVPAAIAGVVTILVEAGETCAVGQVVGRID